VDVPVLIKKRLEELNLEQRDLAEAAEVTESYISQLLNGKKLPPSPERTDIYKKMSKLLKLPADKLATLADVQREAKWNRSSGKPPAPLLMEVRELVLSKCAHEQRARYARSSNANRWASSSASSRNGFWMSSRESPPGSWRTRTGSAWSRA
jgi:transcriptional regulator with XRE-family HTH domain